MGHRSRPEVGRLEESFLATTRRSLLPLLGGLLAVPGVGSAQAAPPTRSLRLTQVVEATPATLYDLFASSAGARILFPGADAWIGDRVGDEYRVAFDPEHSPDGSENGTAGSRILRLDPERGLAFQWRGPPWARAMNVTPLPTRVEVSFTPAVGERATTVVLEHHGFGVGGDWDRAYAFFDQAWRMTLLGLQQRFATTPQAMMPQGLPPPITVYVALLRPGPSWEPGIPRERQARILNHDAYLLSLRARGIVFIGGELGEDGTSLTVFTTPTARDAARYLRVDPAVEAGVLVYELLPWVARLPRTPS